MTAAAPAADSGVVEAPGEATALAPEIGTLVLRKALAAGRELALLDVRTPGEYEVGHIEGALNVPVYELDDKLDEVREFQNGRELVVYCEVGGRTRKAAAMLQAAGFEHVVQYIPGMREWRQEE
jgi:rhodanese-related sulfurtransferase